MRNRPEETMPNRPFLGRSLAAAAQSSHSLTVVGDKTVELIIIDLFIYYTVTSYMLIH